MKRKISLLILLVIAMTSVLALASCKRDEWIIVKEATCTESGLRIYNCIHDNSEHQQNEVIPALGHSYGDWLVLEEATLTQEGIKQHTCTRCHHKELASIPIIEPTLNIIIYDGDKILSTVKLLDDGVYKLTVPAKVGYAFEGLPIRTAKNFLWKVQLLIVSVFMPILAYFLLRRLSNCAQGRLTARIKYI